MKQQNKINREMEELKEKINQSKNIFQYSFLTDFENIPFTNEDMLVEDVSKWVMGQCEFFLHGFDPQFFGLEDGIKSSFFGSTDAQNRWRKMLSDDAVVTIYAALRGIIAKTNLVDAPKALCAMFENGSIVKNFKNKKLCGMEYLLREKRWVLKDDFELEDLQTRNEDLKSVVRRGSTAFRDRLFIPNIEFLKESKNAYKMYESFVCNSSEDPIVEKSGRGEKEKYYFMLGNLEYMGALYSVTNGIQIFGKMADDSREIFYGDLGKYCGRCQEMLDSLRSEYLLPADRIYAHYELEKVFHLGLSNCIYQNVLRLNRIKDSDMMKKGWFGARDIEVFGQASKLPNMLSRNIIVDSAFCFLKTIVENDKNKDKPKNIGDFFDLVRMDFNREAVSYVDTDNIEYIFPIDKWMRRYQKMVNYLANFLFPFYESLFMIALYEGIAKIKNKDTDKKSKLGNDNIIFRMMFDILGKYINKGEIFDVFGEMYNVKENDEKIQLGQFIGNRVDFKSIRDKYDVNYKKNGNEKESEREDNPTLYRQCIISSDLKSKIVFPMGLDSLKVLCPEEKKKYFQDYLILSISKQIF